MTINQYFENIYCINLQRRTDRWEECLNEFKKHDLNVDRFDAADGNNFEPTSNLSSGQVGTVYSHLNVLQRAKEQNLNNVLILEDDIQFDENFVSLFNEWSSEIPDDWDMILFGGNHIGNNPWSPGKLIKVTEHVYKVTHSLALHCYAVKNTVYDKLIKSLSEMNSPADNAVAKVQKEINCYIIRPHLAWQRPSYSDLVGFFADYVGLRDDSALAEGRPFGEEQLKRDDIRDKLDSTWQKIYDNQKEKYQQNEDTQMYDQVTAVLTSCGRLDLLERTITSLSKEFWDKIPVKILTEDSADHKIFEKIKKENESGYLQGWTVILNDPKLGQSASIDKAYSMVETKYVFHLEDDWEFYDDKFIDRSLPILEKYDNIMQVTFRSNSPHPTDGYLYEEGTESEFGVLIPGYNEWPGYTYNPNIFKFSCYESVKPISGKQEKEVGFIFNELDLHTVRLTKTSVDHIGDGRHVGWDPTLW